MATVRPDDRHGRPGGTGVPGRELGLGREGELGDQAVAAGRPAEADEGVVADGRSRHGRQLPRGHGRDLEPGAKRAVIADHAGWADLEREEVTAGAERAAGGGRRWQA